MVRGLAADRSRLFLIDSTEGRRSAAPRLWPESSGARVHKVQKRIGASTQQQARLVRTAMRNAYRCKKVETAKAPAQQSPAHAAEENPSGAASFS